MRSSVFSLYEWIRLFKNRKYKTNFLEKTSELVKVAHYVAISGSGKQISTLDIVEKKLDKEKYVAV